MNTMSGTRPGAEADRPMNDVEVAAYLRCSVRHLRNLVSRKQFPAPVKLGALARWDRATVLAWLRDGTGRTADRGGATVQVRG